MRSRASATDTDAQERVPTVRAVTKNSQCTESLHEEVT